MSQEQEEEYFEHYRFIADEGQEPLRVDKFLMNRLKNTSRNRIQNAARAGSILVNNVAVKQNYKVKAGDIISIVMPEPPRDKEIYPENIPLDIVFEDDHLLIVNKPAGMVVHPGYNNYTGTLVHALAWHFENLPVSAHGKTRPGLVHRIDKDTSGILVIAKEEYVMTHLANQFFNHTIDREYVALVWGNIEEESGRIEGNLARSPKDRRVMQVFEDSEIGKEAITHYRVLERFGYTTLISCKLETGRTHQIRAHLKYLGHPLFNDEWYGGSEIVSGPSFTKYKQYIENCFKLCPRQALHARSLGFVHPETGENLFFEIPLPPDMEQLIEKWRAYTPSF